LGLDFFLDCFIRKRKANIVVHYHNTSAKQYFNFTVAIAVIFGLVSAVGLWYFSAKGRPAQRRFDPIVWKSSAASGPSASSNRREMLDDLLTRYDFRGWSKDQVISLLGNPSPISSGFQQWDLIYIIGLEAGPLALDDEALGFDVDKDGTIIRFGLSVN
jgi:hypothetical protein